MTALTREPGSSEGCSGSTRLHPFLGQGPRSYPKDLAATVGRDQPGGQYRRGGAADGPCGWIPPAA